MMSVGRHGAHLYGSHIVRFESYHYSILFFIYSD